MAETETNTIASDLSAEHQKARRHSDIRVFSGTSAPNVVDMEPEEVSVRTHHAVRDSLLVRSDLRYGPPHRMHPFAGFA